MARKLNYGPRFATNGASVHHAYDEGLDRIMQKDMQRMLHILNNQPLHRKELRYYKAAMTTKKMHAGKDPGPAREESEQRMAEAIRKCVEILEFHMDDMTQHIKAPGRPTYCLQQHIHNVIYELRNRCGVSFGERNPQYAERQCEDRRRRNAKEMHDDIVTEREQQRLSRLRNMKEMAAKMAKWRAEKLR